jgi:hypothetical protein
MSTHTQSPEKRLAQHRLAREFVELVHGPADAADAEAQHRIVFSGKLPLPPLANKKEHPTAAFTMPSHHVTLPRSLITTQAITRIMVSAGLAPSRSEAHRLMMMNAVNIGSRSNRTEMSEDLSFSPVKNWTADKNENYIIDGSLMILRVGKWKLKIIKIISDEEFDKQGLKVPEWLPVQPVKTPEEKGGEEAAKKLETHNAIIKLQHTKRIEDLKKKGFLGPGMSPSHMREREKFAKDLERTKRKGERRMARKAGMKTIERRIVKDEETTKADIRKKEDEFWKGVDL